MVVFEEQPVSLPGHYDLLQLFRESIASVPDLSAAHEGHGARGRSKNAAPSIEFWGEISALDTLALFD